MSYKYNGIGNYIDNWEDERIECFNRYCDKFADYILFLSRFFTGQKES